MGGICGGNDSNTKEIEKKMQLLEKEESVTHKILMLGSGESGKSTFFRQLGWLYGRSDKDKELTLQDKEEAIQPIRQNIVEGILTLLTKSEILSNDNRFKNKSLYINLNDTKISSKISFIGTFSDEQFDKDCKRTNDEIKTLGEYVSQFWKMNEIKNTYNLRSYFSFSDNIDYFFDKCNEIFEYNYIPTQEDVLRSRARTTGVLTITIDVTPKDDQGLNSDKINSFELIDVGGQRSERSKWINHFQNVKAILYVAALNHFAMVTFEDENQNAMHESLKVFNKYINMNCFDETEIILFLNKDDLFREKLKEGYHLDMCFKNNASWKPIEKKNDDKNEIVFTQWTGIDKNGDNINYDPNKFDDEKLDSEYFEKCWNAAKSFIANEYEKRFFRTRPTDETVTLYTHVTTATNKKNVQTIFWDVQNTIVKGNLKDGGLIY